MFDKKCPECGQWVDDDENCCPFCGYKFGDYSLKKSSVELDDLFNMDYIHYDADGNPWYLPPD